MLMQIAIRSIRLSAWTKAVFVSVFTYSVSSQRPSGEATTCPASPCICTVSPFLPSEPGSSCPAARS